MAKAVRPASSQGPTSSEPDPVLVWESVLRMVTGLIRTFEDEMEAEGAALAWYDVLIQLNAAPEGRLRMQTLADRVVLSRSGLTRLIDRMEKAGMVTREASTEDRRGYFAILTNDGRKTYQRLRPGHRASIERHFTRHLSPSDLRALASVTSKINRGNRNQ